MSRIAGGLRLRRRSQARRCSLFLPVLRSLKHIRQRLLVRNEGPVVEVAVHKLNLLESLFQHLLLPSSLFVLVISGVLVNQIFQIVPLAKLGRRGGLGVHVPTVVDRLLNELEEMLELYLQILVRGRVALSKYQLYQRVFLERTVSLKQELQLAHGKKLLQEDVMIHVRFDLFASLVV